MTLRKMSAIALASGLLTAAACSSGNGEGPEQAGSEELTGASVATTTAGETVDPVRQERDFTGTRDGSTTGLADQLGLANPDRAHIDVEDGGTTISVEPRDDRRDYPNLQWALDNVEPGGTVRLGSGAFFLGDGRTEAKHTVRVRRGARIEGRGTDGALGTVIAGGGELEEFAGSGRRLETGPFRVETAEDPHPVSFHGIWFRHWTGSAVYVESSRGFELSSCRISDPVSPGGDGTRFVHAVFTTGRDARGGFTVSENVVELGTYEGSPPHDEQLLGVFFANHDSIEVTHNTIVGGDEAVEIIGNGISPAGEPYEPGTEPRGSILVAGNAIDVTQTLVTDWPGRFAILVANNQRMQETVIRSNSVTVRGLGFAFGLSGERLRIVENAVTLEEHLGSYPPGAMLIGFGSSGRFAMGDSLVDSVVAENDFAGGASAIGLALSLAGGASRGNSFDFGDSLSALGAPVTLRIGPGVYGNSFRGELGNLVDDSPAGANEFRR